VRKEVPIGLVVAGAFAVAGIIAEAALILGSLSGAEADCYRSSMGNPDAVVMIGGDPFACTNNFTGYRCQKMVPCH